MFPHSFQTFVTKKPPSQSLIHIRCCRFASAQTVYVISLITLEPAHQERFPAGFNPKAVFHNQVHNLRHLLFRRDVHKEKFPTALRHCPNKLEPFRAVRRNNRQFGHPFQREAHTPMMPKTPATTIRALSRFSIIHGQASIPWRPGGFWRRAPGNSNCLGSPSTPIGLSFSPSCEAGNDAHPAGSR